jgi:hypothetical protein
MWTARYNLSLEGNDSLICNYKDFGMKINYDNMIQELSAE